MKPTVDPRVERNRILYKGLLNAGNYGGGEVTHGHAKRNEAANIVADTTVKTMAPNYQKAKVPTGAGVFMTPAPGK